MSNELLSFANVNQLDAANNVYRVLQELEVIQADPTLIAVKETDIFRLRRGLCLPSAAASCINAVLGKRIIGEDVNCGRITIGDFFRVAIPYHNKKGLVDAKGWVRSDPWPVVTKQGDMLHQVVIAIAKGLGVESMSITEFKDLKLLIPFIENGGKIALSLDNRFVLDHTLGRDPALVREKKDGWVILIEESGNLDFRRFEEGRHVVSLLMPDKAKRILVYDSFCLPQLDPIRSFMWLSPGQIKPYLNYKTGGSTRAVAFAKTTETLSILEPYKYHGTFVPQVVVNDVKSLFKT